jgi:hypothetical protein
MAYEYLLPITTTAQTATVNGATSAYSCTLNLSADTQLASPPLSGTATATPMTLTFAASYATGSFVVANPFAIKLTIPSNNGDTVIFGKIHSSLVTVTPTTTAFNATVRFNDPNFATTSIVLSGFNTNVRINTTTSQIDNPFIVLNPNGRYTSVFNGLTSSNVFYRTVGRQVRSRLYSEGL